MCGWHGCVRTRTCVHVCACVCMCVCMCACVRAVCVIGCVWVWVSMAQYIGS